jgi:hypothetical protein
VPSTEITPIFFYAYAKRRKNAQSSDDNTPPTQKRILVVDAMIPMMTGLEINRRAAPTPVVTAPVG